MPTVYQGVCRNCSHRTAVMTDGCGAVLVDLPVDAAQTEVAGGGLSSGSESKQVEAAKPRFGEPRLVEPGLVVLAHPREVAILAGTGYTRSDLLRQGRYVSVSNVACRRCGRVFQRRRLSVPGGSGCAAALALGLACGAAAGLAAQRVLIGVIVCYLVCLGVTAAASIIARRRLRRRYPARAAALAAESNCPACGAGASTPISRTKSAHCPSCGQRTLSFENAGRS